MPISTPESWVQKYLGDKDHFNHVLDHLLIPAIIKAGFEPVLPKTKGSELIHGEIIRNIESAEFVLCDMSVLNPNVFFELGIRTSLNKPVCMIKDDLTEKVPFDTAIINNHTYFSALNPWTLDDQIEDLANHIKVSFEKCQDSNSLWTYFGLSSSAQPIKEEDSDAKINFLIKQFEALRERLNQSEFYSRNQNLSTQMNIHSYENERENTLDRLSFENLVYQCLKELEIPQHVQPLQSQGPDFVVINPKNGKNIPIEVKFYTKRVIANELPLKLVRQMQNYMKQVRSDESILFISSEVTPEALARFKTFGEGKIHIITGNSKEELKSQLANIFT